MEILIADRTTPSAASVALTLEARGHVVRGCRDAGTPDGVPCAALRGENCPLDAHPIDVAVSVGPPPVTDRLGAGHLCAVRRRIPLVLLDRPDDPLTRWAATMAPASQAVEAVEAVHAAALPLHSVTARHTAVEELRRRGLDETAVDVQVRRRHGGLQVDLFVNDRLTLDEVEGLAVHVVQSVRLFDPWAGSIDASVHDVTD
jgi:hypothetical protein